MNRTKKTTSAKAKPERKDAERGAEIKTERDAPSLNLTPDEHAGFISILPSGWLVQAKIDQAVWDSLSDSEKQARTEQSMRDQAKAEQLWRELMNRTNTNFDQHKHNLRFSDAFDRFRSAYAVANTGTEKLKIVVDCLSFIAGTPPKLAEGSLDADYLRFLGHTCVIKWLVCAADEHYKEPLLKDLAMRMNSAFLAFFDTQMSNAEAEKESALTEADRKDLADNLLKSFGDYIDTEFPCEPDEVVDEVVEGRRRPGRSRLLTEDEEIKATTLYLDLWPNRHPNLKDQYSIHDMDGELVKQVKSKMKFRVSLKTLSRAIQRGIAYQTGEVIYPLEITLTLNEKQMALVSNLARSNDHGPDKLSPKETVRAALGLKQRRRQK
jgi:hypothetical protein